jgi:hypothetical protein
MTFSLISVIGGYNVRLILSIIETGISFVADNFWEGLSDLKKLGIVGYVYQGHI